MTSVVPLEPRVGLLDALREHLGLAGAKGLRPGQLRADPVWVAAPGHRDPQPLGPLLRGLGFQQRQDDGVALRSAERLGRRLRPIVIVERRHEIGRYGDVVCPQQPPGRRNISELVMNLDDVIPNPHYRMCHSRIVGAPPTVVWDELYRVTMSALPLGRALEGVRLLPARLSGRKRQSLAGRTFLDVTPIPVLFSEPPQVVISAGLSQAWRLLGGSTPPHVDAAALRAWSQPGWIKVGMEFRLEAIPGGTLLSTETRVLATDSRTRRAFAVYWFFIRAGSGAIRREVLRIVAHRAESPLMARRPDKSRDRERR